ncbi:cadherin domain protein [Cooperia oncophora]
MVHSVLPINSPPGTVVTTVHAEDRDSASAGQVHYALLDAITGFSIDSSSGVIQTTEALQDKQYTIRIGATDGHGAMSTNNVTVILHTTKKKPLKWTSGPNTIELPDSTAVGDTLAVYHTSSPSSLELNSNLLSINSIGTLYLSKPLPINKDLLYAVLIAHSDDVSITKCIEMRVIRDSPAPKFLRKNATLRLKRNIPLGNQLMKVDAGGLFNFSTNCQWLRIDNDGIVSVRELIDKSINSVQCEIEAKDAKGRSDRMKIEIAMESDEKPFHLNATYNVHMKEDARTGTMLIGLGTDSAYVFRSSLKTHVDVFPDGTVYLRKPIDSGGPDMISLPVTATHRVLNNTYSAMVRVFIDDVNDHSPQCPIKRSFEIQENIRVGSTVGYLEARDDDIGLNGVIGYRLLDNQNLIRVGTATGKVLAQKLLYSPIIHCKWLLLYTTSQQLARKSNFSRAVFAHFYILIRIILLSASKAVSKSV